ncbi:hypothetical protein LTR47_009998 [Exophiala xenobiotica]|nr:hypothetical protein LTR47_009998 [Exophiala xenobiotica]KAK5230848.1 hypothetical protein LTR72_000027 [Exophiala xenobiotica]KAK5245591.1 hypothetical protein LTS06_009009 [Exophiala xenobiotica]KAK5282785.1 hypothetical protein LTR40_002771 [Exophiala xenobiotica]KAK5373076.1 hypothetical protein LTR11_005815 [Exophiala xenobiotica]
MALQNSLATVWKTQHPPTDFMGRLPLSCLFKIVRTVALAEPTSTYTIKQLSLVDKQIRHLCLPFLFTLGFTQLELNKPPNEMQEHVQALAKSPVLIRFSINDLRLELFPNRNGDDGLRSGEVNKDLVACLEPLAMLTELHVNLANDLGLTIGLRQGLERPLRDVKKLRLSGVYKAGALIRACPSVQHLSMTCDSDRDWKRALREISHMRHLICVELVNFGGWTPALLIGEEDQQRVNGR